MSDCPYFDASHSMADLYYVCKAETRQRKIGTKDVDRYPCFEDNYIRCRHYPDKKGTEKKEKR